MYRYRLKRKKVIDLQQLESIRDMIYSKTLEDVKEKGNRAELVFARKVFTKIAKDKKYTYADIARFLNRSYAGVQAYDDDMSNILSYNNEFRDEYFRIVGTKIKKSDPDYFYLLIGTVAKQNLN